MISTTAVPSGERGGASLAGNARSRGSSTFLSSLYMFRSPPITSNPPPCLTYCSRACLPAGGNRLQVPVVEDHQLVIVQVDFARIVDAIHIELRGGERGREMRILRRRDPAICTAPWDAAGPRPDRNALRPARRREWPRQYPARPAYSGWRAGAADSRRDSGSPASDPTACLRPKARLARDPRRERRPPRRSGIARR